MGLIDFVRAPLEFVYAAPTFSRKHSTPLGPNFGEFIKDEEYDKNSVGLGTSLTTLYGICIGMPINGLGTCLISSLNGHESIDSKYYLFSMLVPTVTNTLSGIYEYLRADKPHPLEAQAQEYDRLIEEERNQKFAELERE